MKTKGMESLPIHAKTAEIIAALRKHQVVIVVGETGSGKTTQLPSLLYAEGFGNKGAIAITEPRRIAATSVARFVAGEMGVTLGKEVGYKVRFDDRSSRQTVIKFLTDGMLLKEIQNNPDLAGYSVVMLDEAHERNANIDLLLGLLKRLIARRPELKVVVSSATIDADKFSRYFADAPVIEVSGRLHAIKVVWGDDRRCADDDEEMVNAVVEKVAAIHHDESEGDVLVFMPGADTINLVLEKLEEKKLQDAIFLPAHGALSTEEQEKIFLAYPEKRKVVVATNIAETSITIDGIVYVVDPGLVKETHFHPLSGIQSLDVIEHSQSGCSQRAGRAGRTRPGVCFRLYSEEGFAARPLYTEPEIKRMSLASVVLQMEALGIKDIPNFDFIDPPPYAAFLEAYEILVALGAITMVKSVSLGLTEMGRAMADLPLDPTVGRMLLEAEKYGCERDVATVAAFLSLPKGVFMRPKGKEAEADYAHEKFKNPDSDALTILSVWRAYEDSGWNRAWCFENFLHSRALWEAKSIREQLLQILKQRGASISEAKDEEAVMKSVAAGLIYNLSRKSGLGFGYSHILRKGMVGEVSYIHPGSAMFGGRSRFAPKSPWIVANELVRTTKLWMRGCSTVETEWLPELAPTRFRFGEPELVSYTAPEDTAEARRPILFRSDSNFESTDVVGWKEEDVSLADAKKIQGERIEAAQRKGLVLLRVERGTFRTVARFGNEICQVESWGELYPEEGGWYYCSLSEGGFLEHLRATPRCKVLDFDGAFERQQGEKEQERIRAEWEESRHSGDSFAPPDARPYRANRARTVVPTRPAETPLPSVEDALAAFNKKFGAMKEEKKK